MKRAAIAYCADVEPRRFDLLLYRDQLPFPPQNPPARYTLSDAFELRLFMCLVENEGASLELAQQTVFSVDKLLVHPLCQLGGEPDLWVGKALIQDPNLGEGAASYHSFGVAGTLAEIATNADSLTRDFSPDARLLRLVTVNASLAARFVRNRARELGLPEGDDFSPIETRAAIRAFWANKDQKQ